MWSSGTFRLILMIFVVAASVAVTYADTRVLGWGNLLDVAISPNGTVAAAAGADGSLVFLFLDGTGWKAGYAISCGSPPISLVFSLDGRWLYSIHDDGILRVWDTQDKDLAESIPVFEEGDAPGGLALSPTGEFIAVGSWTSGVKVVDLVLKEVVHAIGNYHSGIALAFVSPDELVVGTPEGKVYRWLPGEEPRELYSHGNFVNKVVFRDGHLISVSDDKTAVAYDLRAENVRARFRLPNFIRALNPHPRGRWVVLGSYREAVVWDFLGGLVVARVRVPGWVSGIACHPWDGDVLLVTWEGEVLVWDLGSEELSSVSKLDFGAAAAVSCDGSLLVTASDRHIRLYRLPSLELLRESLLAESIWKIVWLPRKDAFVTWGSKGIQIWEAASLCPQGRLEAHVHVWKFYPSPNSEFLAIEGWRNVALCNVKEMACKEFPLPEEGTCHGVAAAPDGDKLAVLITFHSNYDREQRLVVWDVSTGRSFSYLVEDFGEVFFWEKNIVLVGVQRLRIVASDGASKDLSFSPGWPPICCLREDGVLACSDYRGEVSIIDLKRPHLFYRANLCKAWVKSLYLCNRFVAVVTEKGTLVIHDLPEEFVLEKERL